MPPRRRSTAPDPLDIDRVRADLAAGKAVRVAIASSAQFPDGASGRVRALADPEVVGAEFVEVEVAVNGIKDVIPFAPTDLAPPAPRRRDPGDPGSSLPTQPVPGSRTTVDRPRPVPGSVPTEAGRPAAPPASPPSSGNGSAPSAAPPRPAAAPTPAPHGAATGSSTGPAAPSAPSAKSGARRPARAITVTLTTSEAEPTTWRVEARIGAKVALRSTPVSPARAWELVQSLDNEALSSAVGAVLEQHRQATAARAEALAAELAAVQAELAALPPA